MHQSIRTIEKPEFINLQPVDINPLMSACQIKVLYVGENRNRSYITKEVATQMAATLRGAPIVGYYREDKGDFADHGERVIFDDQGVHFECMTRPYGFVAPDADVWFQTFEDEDDFGNKTVREYLMTTGYLWTGQFEECKDVVDSGRPHSMELDEETLDGKWSKNSKSGMDFFIINDAIFSKLCILGNDVEPCFEGSSVTAPDKFALTIDDDTFRNTLFSMIKDMQSLYKGGNDTMNEEIKGTSATEPVGATSAENFTQNSDKIEKTDFTENQNGIEGSFKKEEEKEKPEDKKEEGKDSSEETPAKKDGEDEDKKKKKDEEEYKCNDDEEKKKYTALEEKYSDLESKYSALEAQYNELVEFKQNIELEKKTALIAEFTMLTDDDKKDVVDNINKYSLDEIEMRLSVIGRRKGVNFSAATEVTDASEPASAEPITTFNLNNTESSDVPAWIRAIENNRKNS